MRCGTVLVVLGVGMAGVARSQVPPVPRSNDRPADAAPRLSVSQRVIDLGPIVEGARVPVTWHIENQGTADLVINRTAAACGCTVVELSDDQRVVVPGASLDLTAQFDSRKRFGPQSKSVTVYSNDPLEPELRLLFQVEVESLFVAEPQSILNLRDVQRGMIRERAIRIKPGPKRREVKIVEVSSRPDSPFTFEAKPVRTGDTVGQEIDVRVKDDVPLGPVGQGLRILVDVDGHQGEALLSLRGEVVGDITWLPKVVDTTRQPSLPGKRLVPVVLQSADGRPFEVRQASAGPLLEVSIERSESSRPQTRYTVVPALRAAAPAGPFGAMLRITTSSLDQPVVEVPVYGIVAPAVEVDPPLVVLRRDGSAVGGQRRVKLQATTTEVLNISGVSCDFPGVSAAVNREASSRYRHIRYVDVQFGGPVATGTHEATLTVTTNIANAERIEIPLRIEAPGDPG